MTMADGLIPFENLTSMPARTAVARAETILASGWSHGGKYPVIDIAGEVPWDDDGPEHRSWNFHIHCLDMIQDLLHAHSESGRQDFLDPALRIAMEWARRHPDPASARGSQFAWYDMAVGLRAQRMAYLLDVVSRDGAAEDGVRSMLETSLELHRAFLADDANIVFHNNHGFYQVAGQLAMGRRFSGRLPGMDEAYHQGLARLRRMLEQQFTREGVHREHSPDYHRMVYDSLAGIIASGLVQDPELLGMAGRIEDSLAWFVLPNGLLLNFGDTDARVMRSSEAEAAERWRRPPMQFVASAGTLGAPPAGPVSVFAESGYWIARSRWQPGTGEEPGDGYLAMAAAFHSRTHKHADDLSFAWYDRGEELLVDAGRYGYLGKTEVGSELWEQGFWYSDPKRLYVESTRAHNTVEIDGRDFPRKGVKPYGSALGRHGTATGGVHFCEAEARQFGSIRHARVLAWLPGQWLLVFDWLHDNAGADHHFRQWFHLAPALSLFPSAEGFVTLPRRSAQPLRIESLLPEPRPMRLALGQEQPVLQGHYSPKEKTLIPNYAFGFEVAGAAGTGFATLFCHADELRCDREWSTMARSGRNARFRWVADGVGSSIVIARPADGELVLEHRRDA